MKEKVDEPLTKVNRSPKNKLSIIETKININPEEPSRHGSGKANSPVNLMVQERGQRSQLNPPKSSNSPLVEANNHQLLKAENRPELESIEVERLKVSSGDLDNGEIRSPYIVNTIKEVTEPDLSIMYPRKRNESRLHSGEAKSIFASNRQLLNKKLFNIEGKSDLSKGENLKVLEEIKLQELVCKAVPNFAQKLINKHLMTRGDQMEEKPKSTPAKKTSGFTKELQADDSYKLKRIEAVDHQEQSHIFDGEYMAFSAQGSLRKDKEN